MYFIACTIWNPKLEEYIPLAKGIMLGDTRSAETKYYRATDAKYNWHKNVWRVFCRDESTSYKCGKWIDVKHLIPQFSYNWCNFFNQFWIEGHNTISQLDGVCGDVNSTNIGERLREMIGDWDENEVEIKESVTEIEEHGIDTDGVVTHSRFNNTGLAMKASVM